MGAQPWGHLPDRPRPMGRRRAAGMRAGGTASQPTAVHRSPLRHRPLHLVFRLPATSPTTPPPRAPAAAPIELSVHFAVRVSWAERLRTVVRQAGVAPLPPLVPRLLARHEIAPAQAAVPAVPTPLAVPAMSAAPTRAPAATWVGVARRRSPAGLRPSGSGPAPTRQTASGPDTRPGSGHSRTRAWESVPGHAAPSRVGPGQVIPGVGALDPTWPSPSRAGRYRATTLPGRPAAQGWSPKGASVGQPPVGQRPLWWPSATWPAGDGTTGPDQVRPRSELSGTRPWASVLGRTALSGSALGPDQVRPGAGALDLVRPSQSGSYRAAPQPARPSTRGRSVAWSPVGGSPVAGPFVDGAASGPGAGPRPASPRRAWSVARQPGGAAAWTRRDEPEPNPGAAGRAPVGHPGGAAPAVVRGARGRPHRSGEAGVWPSRTVQIRLVPPRIAVRSGPHAAPGALLVGVRSRPSLGRAAARQPAPHELLRRHSPVARVHRTVPDAPPRPVTVAAPPQQQAAPPPAPVDLDRLDRDLWRRFEKRMRIEQERHGRR